MIHKGMWQGRKIANKEMIEGGDEGTVGKGVSQE